MHLKLVFATLIAALAAIQTPAKAALFLGETVSVSLNYSSATVTSFEDAMASVGPFTIDGVAVNNGVSQFNPNVTMFVTATETVVSPVNSIVEITIVGRDATGALANPIAAGSLAQDATPFTIAWFDMGAYNGGTDGLFPSSSGLGSFVINSAEYILQQTDGNAFGSFTFNVDNPPPAPITGFGGVNFGGDIAAFQFEPGIGYAGATLRFDITAVVPEPSSAALLLGGMCFLRRRRRA